MGTRLPECNRIPGIAIVSIAIALEAAIVALQPVQKDPF
jgi:hypothetical protein